MHKSLQSLRPSRHATPRDDVPPKKTLSLKDQLAQLQQKVDEMYKTRRSTNDAGFNRETSARESRPLPDASDSQDALSIPSSSADVMLSGFDDMCNSSIYNSSFSIDWDRRRSAIFKTTDTFVPSTRCASDIAISSKIRALQGQRSRNTKSTMPESNFDDTNEQSFVTAQLPQLSVLWSEVDDFFREFPCFFPFLREGEVRKQITTLLNRVEYDTEHCHIMISSTNCKLAAILFSILAYSEAVMESTPETGNELLASSDTPPGSEKYCQGLHIMEYFGQLHDNDIETVIYHALSASFFFAAEKLQMALDSASVSLHIARYIELNNPRQWPKNVDDELACRQSLWWTLYFLDKRISQKIGITYCVREDECGAKEFIDTGEVDYQGHHELLQSMITFSHLWTKIWDSFFSATSAQKDMREELEVTDTRILLSYRRIPSSLHWKTGELVNYLATEGEHQIRRRLLVWLVSYYIILLFFEPTVTYNAILQRFTFLRLSIRHDHLKHESSDRQRRGSCISICKSIVEAAQAYIDMFGHHKPSGHMLTSALVESLYWVEIERRQLRPIVPEATLTDIITVTGNLLHGMALNIGAASRAYESLSDLLSSGLPAFASQDISTLLDKPEDQAEVEPSIQDLLNTTAGSMGSLGTTTEMVPEFDMVQESIAQGAESFVEGGFDVPNDMDWNFVLNSFSSAKYSAF